LVQDGLKMVRHPSGEKRQIPIAFSGMQRERLEVAAKQNGHSLAEEVRRRLERTFDQDDLDAPTRKLIAAIESLTTLVRLQTNYDWHAHAGAHRVLRHAINARLARLKPEGEPTFNVEELPKARLVAADDPDTMGKGLEAIDAHTPPLSYERRKELFEKFRQELLDQYPHLREGKR
jgi:hypothetical protein